MVSDLYQCDKMVTIKDGCGCDPCDCDWKQKLKEAYARAIQSVNKIGDFDGSVYFPDGSGFVKLPIPKLADVQQISKNTQDITDLKVADAQLQADITAETAAREEAIAAEASARETAITAEATAREEAIAAEASARKEAISAEASVRKEAISAEASARESKDTELVANIARIDNTDAGQDQRIQDNADRINSTYNDLVATEATVATHDSEIITLKANNQALAKTLVSDVLMTDGTTAGSVQVSIEREDGSLITSANYRWGRDIGIRLEAGTQAGYVKAVISLSDGTELVSNEYKIVEVLESDVYVTAINLIADQAAGTLGGNISYSNGTTQTINSVSVPTAPGVTSAIETLQTRMTAVEQKNTTQDSQISAIDGRVQALENVPVIEQFAAGKLGTIAGSSIDGRVKAENDGTGSVNGWNNLKSKVSTAESQIVSAQNDISTLNGTVAQQTTDISGMKTDITNLKNKNTQQDQSIAANTSAIATNTSAIAGKVAINQGTGNAGKVLGVNASGNVEPTDVSSGGGEVWEEIDIANFPRDWIDGDRIRITTQYCPSIPQSNLPTSWSSAITNATYAANPSSRITFEGLIRTDGFYINKPVYTDIIKNGSKNVAIGIMTLGFVYKLSAWNSTNSGPKLIDLNMLIFNGNSCDSSSITVTKANISTYITKLERCR